MSEQNLGHFQGEAHTARSLQIIGVSKSLRTFALLTALLLVGLAAGLAYVPWQQSVTGAGKVIVMSPMERPQNIEAQIPARLAKWHVREGDIVKTGDTIAELQDIDSKFLDEEQVGRLQAQMRAQQAKRDAALARFAAIEQQIGNVTRSRGVAVPAAEEKARQNDDKLNAARQSVEASRQSQLTAELNLARLRELHEQGLRSKRDLELAELEAVRTKTEYERAKASLEVARRDTSIGNYDQMKVDADTAAALSSLQASQASVRESVATIEGDILKLEIELQNVSQRGEQRVVRAPCDGQIVRQLKVGTGATVKAGDVLTVIAPVTQDRAVEIFLSDNDAPLVQKGRRVRLQFAGWPAVQVVGWPSVAVGTFGGKVAFIDPVDDGKSRYRVIIVPDERTIKKRQDEPWPAAEVLRPGAEASGWIMLDTVSIGFELWRQFNAFPPSVELDPKNKPADEKMLGDEDPYKPLLKK